MVGGQGRTSQTLEAFIGRAASRLEVVLTGSADVNAVQDARVALLSGLIDHAPVFPPASLPLPAALEVDARARASAASFMLGRFVCPASGLHRLPPVGRGVSVVLNASFRPREDVEAVETTTNDGLDELPRLAREVYVEVPLDEGLELRLDELAARGLCAKVRCGGTSVPDEWALGGFVRACGERGIPFKATAGLHHAGRTEAEHGFLNLLAAAVFGEEEAALAETDPEAFSLDADAFSWGDRRADAAEVAQARVERLRSIGSCSFFEPVEELEQRGVLPL
jgi:hypothetical protein